MLFGHSQQVWTCFGHLLDIFLTIDIFWSLFWTLLVFLRPKCVRPLIVLEHRDEINSLQIQLSRTQAGPGRAVKEQQEQNSPYHVRRINLISVQSGVPG